MTNRNRYFFYPCNTEKRNIQKKNTQNMFTLKTHVESNTFTLQNALRISRHLQESSINSGDETSNEISRFFCPLNLISNTHIAEINEDLFTSEARIKKQGDYIIYSQKEPRIKNTLYDSLYNTPTITKQNMKSFFMKYIYSLKKILLSLSLLREKEIVVGNIHPSTIWICDECPYIHDFATSFLYSDTERFYRDNRIKTSLFLPLEARILEFITKNDNFGMTMNDLENICEAFIGPGPYSLSALSIFDKTFLEEYKKRSIFSLRWVVNKSKQEVLCRMSQAFPSWNLYGLSIMYLLVMRDFFIRPNQVRFNNNQLLMNIYHQLRKNIAPEFEERDDEIKNMLILDNILFTSNVDDMREIGKT
jgi:hypothetical protein|tara:strand:+ start:247 stop:1332 length:1086 start_codon:yes stop_codon:yes gene_type:complete